MEKKHPNAGRVHLMPGYEDCRDHPVPAIVIKDDGTPDYGDVVPLKDGQPLLPGGYLVMPDDRGDLRVVDLGHSGPAQVATEQYRDGWSRTFDSALN